MIRVGSKVFQTATPDNGSVMVAGWNRAPAQVSSGTGAGAGKLGTVSGARESAVGAARVAVVSGGLSGSTAGSTAGLPPNMWYEAGVLWAMPSSPSGAAGSCGPSTYGSTQTIQMPYPIAFDNQSAFRQCMQANIKAGGNKIEFPPGAGPYGSSFQTATTKKPVSGTTMTYVAGVLNMARYARNFVDYIGACYIDDTGRPMLAARPVVPVSSLASVRAPSPNGQSNAHPTLVMICGLLNYVQQVGLRGCAFQTPG